MHFPEAQRSVKPNIWKELLAFIAIKWIKMVQSNLKWSFEFGIGMAAIIPFWMKLRGFLVVGL